MSTLSILFSSLVVITIILTAAGYTRLRITMHKRMIPLALRIVALMGVLFFFFQPTLRFSRIASREVSTAILVDASESMRLFGPDSIVRMINSLCASSDDGTMGEKYECFLFGDSLRQHADGGKIVFHDRHSLFPHSLDAPEIKAARNIIIVSDGNWTNTTPPRTILDGKNIYYIMLGEPERIPYVSVEVTAIPKEVIAQTPAPVSIAISGYHHAAGTVAITVRDRRRIVARQTVHADSGIFRTPVGLSLPMDSIGTRTYTLTAGADDSLSSTVYFTIEVLQQEFLARLYAPAPSLDNRFLRLALRRNGWLIADSIGTGRAPDVLFLFDWNDTAASYVRNFATSTSVVFVGTLPCGSALLDKPQKFAPMLGGGDFLPAVTALFNRLPPPQAVAYCPQPLWSNQYPIASIQGQDSANRSGSVPFLFEATYANRHVLCLSIRGIWRWDFWLPIDEHRESRFLFSDFFFGQVKELVRINANRTLSAYPYASPCHENDSIAFQFVIPASTSNENAPLHFSISQENGAVALDTVLNLDPVPMHRLKLDFAPLPVGRYIYRCTTLVSGTIAAVADSLKIFRDNAELRATEQNRLLLDQYALPLPTLDSTSASSLSRNTEHDMGGSATIPWIVSIKQSWPLLMFIMGLLGAEWFLRKLWRVD
jgi:hypothetical protein